MLRKLCLILVLLGVASPTFGQLNLSFTSFQPGQTISSAQFTANFTAISSNALNRTNGVMTGPLQVQNMTVGTNNTYDLGATGARFRDFWLARNATIGGDVDITGTLDVGGVTILSDLTTSTATVTTADIISLTVTNLTCTGCVGATQLASTTVNPSTYGSAAAVASFAVDADGRITSANGITIQIVEDQVTDGTILARVGSTETITGAWTFSTAPVLAGNGITGLLETGIADGTIFPRLGSTETITGAWTFNAGLTSLGGVLLQSAIDLPQITWFSPGQTTNEKRWLGIVIDGDWHLRAYDDSIASSTAAIIATRTGTAITGIALNAPVSTLALSSHSVIPATDSTYTLGTNSVRWSHGYFDDITIGAALAATSYCISGTETCFFGSGENYVLISLDDSLNVFYAEQVAGSIQSIRIGDQASGNASVNITPAWFIGRANNVQSLGTAGTRWTTVFSTLPDNISSDIRLKENIIELPYGLEDLKRINVYQYNMIGDTSVQNGVIAQQLLEAGFGHIVSGSESEGYGVAYTELIPVLIKSIQELEARVAKLEGR